MLLQKPNFIYLLQVESLMKLLHFFRGLHGLDLKELGIPADTALMEEYAKITGLSGKKQSSFEQYYIETYSNAYVIETKVAE